MSARVRRSYRSRRPQLSFGQLEPRLTPAVTAAFAGGLLVIISDNATDDLLLRVQGDGAFALTDSNVTVSLPNNPTIANVDGISIQLNGGDDRISLAEVPAGNWTVVVDGGIGADSILGSAGSDVLLGGDGEDTMDGGSGDDVVDGGDDADTLHGGPGDDTVLGRIGNDDLFGDAGNDVLVGHQDRDDYIGGPGDDFYDGFKDDDASEDEVRETAFTDLIATNFSLFGVGYDTFKGIDTITLDGNQGNNVLDASACTIPVLLRGNGGNDRLIGGTANDFLLGGSGNDTMFGGAGDDLFDGDLDNDSLFGDAGNDTLTGDFGNDTLDGGAGVDRVKDRTESNFTLTNTSLVGLGTDKLANIEQAELEGGSSSNRIVATLFTGSTTLLGGSGNDTLIGGKGADSLSGQGGKDSLNGGPGLDAVVEISFVTNDFLLTDTRLIGGTVIDDKLALIETARLTANNGINTLNASAFTRGGVFLDGGLGNDVLIGTGKNDTLVGNQGDDTIDGRGGTDTVQETGDANFTLTTGATTSTLTGTNNFGTDTLTGVEQGFLAGGDSNNTLNASGFTAGPVTLVGGAGDDVLTGSPNNDTLTGGEDNDNLNGGAGTDTIAETVTDSSVILTNTSLAGSSNGVGVTNPLAGFERAHLTGNLNQNSFTVSGWTGEAILDGGGGDDSVGSSNDLNFILTDAKLTRSDGANFNLISIERANLAGGVGDNEFNIGGFKGTMSLNGGGGTADTVVAIRNTNMVLGNNSLLFADAAGASLNGISRARLTGGAGNNTLDASNFTLGPVTLSGGVGNDVLLGGDGDDRLDGGSGTDVVNGGFGNDIALNAEIKLSIP